MVRFIQKGNIFKLKLADALCTNNPGDSDCKTMRSLSFQKSVFKHLNTCFVPLYCITVANKKTNEATIKSRNFETTSVCVSWVTLWTLWRTGLGENSTTPGATPPSAICQSLLTCRYSTNVGDPSFSFWQFLRFTQLVSLSYFHRALNGRPKHDQFDWFSQTRLNVQNMISLAKYECCCLDWLTENPNPLQFQLWVSTSLISLEHDSDELPNKM